MKEPKQPMFRVQIRPIEQGWINVTKMAFAGANPNCLVVHKQGVTRWYNWKAIREVVIDMPSLIKANQEGEKLEAKLKAAAEAAERNKIQVVKKVPDSPDD